MWQLLALCLTLWRQIHLDMFFVDWEKPRGAPDQGEHTGPTSDYSALSVTVPLTSLFCLIVLLHCFCSGSPGSRAQHGQRLEEIICGQSMEQSPGNRTIRAASIRPFLAPLMIAQCSFVKCRLSAQCIFWRRLALLAFCCQAWDWRSWLPHNLVRFSVVPLSCPVVRYGLD